MTDKDSQQTLATAEATPLKSILALVEYLEDDERKHFEQMSDNGEDTSEHIFNHVRTVSDWLLKRRMQRTDVTDWVQQPENQDIVITPQGITDTDGRKIKFY